MNAEMQSGDEDTLVKAHEAAPALGLSASFLYAGAKAGIVPCYRAGDSVRYSIPELRQWMRQQAEQRLQQRRVV